MFHNLFSVSQNLLVILHPPSHCAITCTAINHICLLKDNVPVTSDNIHNIVKLADVVKKTNNSTYISLVF